MTIVAWSFTFEMLDTIEDVRRAVQECQGMHVQQVAYSTFHDALTQVCFGCRRVRSNHGA